MTSSPTPPEAEHEPVSSGRASWSRLASTYGWLGIPAVVGLIIRLVAVASWFPTCEAPKFFGEKLKEGCMNPGWGDAFYFQTQAKLLADGHGFSNPGTWFVYIAGNRSVPEFSPGAGHPPIYTSFLALLYKLGLDDPAKQRYVFPFVGVVGIVLIGILAMRLGRGRRSVGLVAASVAATYPILWINDWRYLSESIYIPMIAAFLLVFYRFWRTPTWGWAVGLGLAFGVVGLTRGEGFLVLACTLPFLLWGMRTLDVKRRLALGGVVVAVMGAVMLPWIAYNLNRFDRPVLLTSGTGMVLLHGSCDEAFSGDAAGYYSFVCAKGLPALKDDPGMAEEAYADDVARQQAMDYTRAHVGELPRVATVRALRLWGLYRPFQSVDYDDQLEGRGYLPSLIGLWYGWALIPFAVYGAVDLRRRRIPLSPMLGILVAVTITAAASFGVTRYRVPADVAVVVMAAVGLDALARLLIARFRGSAPDAEEPAPPMPPPEPVSEEPVPVAAGAGGADELFAFDAPGPPGPDEPASSA